MTDRYDFKISFTRDHNSTIACPLCKDQFTTGYVDIHDANNLPICHLCAWERIPEFASMISLSETAHRYGQEEMPSAIQEALLKRKSNPEKLRIYLEAARDTHFKGGQMTPLQELVSHEIDAALKGDDVGLMQAAKLVVDECDFDSPIPF